MKSQERRRYFRIDDEMVLAWRVLDKAEKEKRMEQFSNGDLEYPDPTRLFLALEADIATLIGQLSPRDPTVAQILRLMNRKVNLISRGPLMSGHRTSIFDEAPQFVNISACGMAFMVEKSIPVGTDIQVELVLVPEGSYILCYGVVINCEKSASATNERHYRANVDFTAIREEDRDRLIQHIMQKELEMLQTRRRQGAKK